MDLIRWSSASYGSLSHRLGLRMCCPHRCRCRATIGELALHPLSCILSAGQHFRHATINYVIQRAIDAAGIPSQHEPLGHNRGDGKWTVGLPFPLRCWQIFDLGRHLLSYLVSDRHYFSPITHRIPLTEANGTYELGPAAFFGLCFGLITPLNKLTVLAITVSGGKLFPSVITLSKRMFSNVQPAGLFKDSRVVTSDAQIFQKLEELTSLNFCKALHDL